MIFFIIIIASRRLTSNLFLFELLATKENEKQIQTRINLMRKSEENRKKKSSVASVVDRVKFQIDESSKFLDTFLRSPILLYRQYPARSLLACVCGYFYI